MSTESLTIITSLIISIIGTLGASKLNNFRLKKIEEKVDNMTEIFTRLTKLETVIEFNKM